MISTIYFQVFHVELMCMMCVCQVVETPTSSYMKLDYSKLKQDGDGISVIVAETAGDIKTIIDAIGAGHPTEGDVIPELNLRYLAGKWYFKTGSIS